VPTPFGFLLKALILLIVGISLAKHGGFVRKPSGISAPAPLKQTTKATETAGVMDNLS
jgi:hypothetical protein